MQLQQQNNSKEERSGPRPGKSGGTHKPSHDQPTAALTGHKRELGPKGWSEVLWLHVLHRFT